VVVVGELASQVALAELTASAGRLLDIQPTTAAPGGQPSGLARWRDEIVVATRGVGSCTRFQIADDRLVAVSETQLPGAQPRAVTVLGNRAVVALQDIGVLAVHPLPGPGNPELVIAPHVSDFGSIPNFPTHR
jgi:hypothetical protein